MFLPFIFRIPLFGIEIKTFPDVGEYNWRSSRHMHL